MPLTRSRSLILLYGRPAAANPDRPGQRLLALVERESESDLAVYGTTKRPFLDCRRGNGVGRKVHHTVDTSWTQTPRNGLNWAETRRSPTI